MTKQEAKEILILFRPGTADEQDRAFEEARRLAKSDPELGIWFEEQCGSYLGLRRKFQEIPVPPGLKDQILAERKTARPFFPSKWVPWLAAAAVAALICSVEMNSRLLKWPSTSHAEYVNRMTEVAMQFYNMDYEMNDPAKIRAFLASKGSVSDFTLPPGLQKAEMAGCALEAWQKHPVAMICFKSGRRLPPGSKADLWLFVADRATVRKSPAPGAAPIFEMVDAAMTASWSDESKTYVLAALGDESLLRKYVP